MSACIAITKGEIGYVLTDGAVVVDGVNTGSVTKCFPVGSLNCLVMTRGTAVAIPPMVWLLSSSFYSFDHVISELETRLRSMIEVARPYFALTGHPEAQYTIVGYSAARKRAEIYDFHTVEGEAPEGMVRSPLLTLSKWPDDVGIVMPPPNAAAIDEAGVEWDGDDFVPEVDMLKVMEVLRQTPYEYNGAPAFTIGSNALLSTVGPNGITQRVLHRWHEDKIGERMAPTPINWSEWDRAHPRRSARRPYAGPFNR